MSSFFYFQRTALFSCFLFVVACGGGSSGNPAASGTQTPSSSAPTASNPPGSGNAPTSSNPPTSSATDTAPLFIAGGGVKGPLAYASVELYAMDARLDKLYDPATPLAVTTTNAYAQITGLPVPKDIPPPYILVIDGTQAIDLNTGVAPVVKRLVTVITREALYAGQAIFATPYTTIAYHMLRAQSSQTATPVASTSGKGLIQQSVEADGLISIEAEDFDARVSQGGHSWVPSTQSGNSGTGVLVAEPNNGTRNNDDYVGNSPRADYKVNFVKTGVHYVWVRGLGRSGSDDSLHLGLDGAAVPTADRIGGLTDNLSWTDRDMGGALVTLNIASPGEHVINLWMREDGALVDKIVLTTRSGYSPGGDAGPSSSPRNGSAGSSLPTAEALSDFSKRIVASVGFGMSNAIDVQSTPPILTSATTTLKDQEQVVQYRAAIEALSSLVYEIQLAVGMATSDEVLELMSVDLYDDNMLNSMLAIWDVGALLAQNPMAMQIANTQYQVRNIVPLMQEERTLVGDSSNVSFVQEDMAFNLQPIRVAAATDAPVKSPTAPVQDKPIGSGSGENNTPIVSLPTKIPAPESTTPRYLSEDFESKDWKKRYEILGDVKRQGGKAARSGAFGLRMKVSKNKHWGGSIRFDHARHGQVGNFKEIWTRYYVRFGSNWRRNNERSGKAGYRARSDEVCNAPCLEMTDSHEFSASGSIKGYSYFHRNVSDANIGSRSYEYSRRDWNGGNREREQWYCVETHHVLNTPGKDNGIYQNWMDGALVSDQRDLRQRDSATFDIDSSALIAYVGGDWVADRNMDVYFDDWAVSDKRIGCQ